MKGDKLREGVDYRALYKISKSKKTLIPRVDEMLDRIGGSNAFSKIVLKKWPYQVRMKAYDVKKTSITSSRLFEYLVIPMRACNATAELQTSMNQVLHECMDELLWCT